jgi:hypothetical protein
MHDESKVKPIFGHHSITVGGVEHQFTGGFMGEAKRKKDARPTTAWERRAGLAIANWAMLLTVVFWGGGLILYGWFSQKGPAKMNQLKGRTRFLGDM